MMFTTGLQMKYGSFNSASILTMTISILIPCAKFWWAPKFLMYYNLRIIIDGAWWKFCIIFLKSNSLFAHRLVFISKNVKFRYWYHSMRKQRITFQKDYIKSLTCTINFANCYSNNFEYLKACIIILMFLITNCIILMIPLFIFIRFS